MRDRPTRPRRDPERAASTLGSLSGTPFPQARYRPICPFCTKPLKTDTRAGEQPFNRILFQSDNNSHDDDDGTLSQEGDGSFATNLTPTSADRKRADDASNAS